MNANASVNNAKGQVAARVRVTNGSSVDESQWTFLTNHASVLLHIAEHPDDTLREIAVRLGLTERTTAAVVADLRTSGYIHVTRRGRHNHYRVNKSKRLRRAAHRRTRVGSLISALSVFSDDKEDLKKPALVS